MTNTDLILSEMAKAIEIQKQALANGDNETFNTQQSYIDFLWSKLQ